MRSDDGDVCEEEQRSLSLTEFGGPVEGDGGRTTLDAIFGCLHHSRRRFILYYLQDNEKATVDELARQIAAREAAIPPAEVDADQQKRVATSLVHAHLPKLADEVFIEYDQRSNEIRYTEPPALLEEVFRLLARFEKIQ